MNAVDEAAARVTAFLPEFVDVPDESVPTQLGAAKFADDVRAVIEDRARLKTELEGRHARESADAAAGSYANRAELAEAERDRLARELEDLRSAVARELPPLEHINARLAEFPMGGEQNYLELARDIWQILGAAEYRHSPAVLVREFHTTFGLPAQDAPALIDESHAWARQQLLLEETREVGEAVAENNLPGVAHELADVVYVAYGTALVYGIDLDAVLAEVHRANMSKLDATGKPLLRADGKVLKSALYRAPNVAGVLQAQIEDGGAS